ncbi:alpha/beta fold hydrolase [Xylophilus sp.]|uniref:alpha/beta fold hydrolase n=1 Tax=Xylophilus sp. TaxID=2653893 RepID=UPI0013B86656|nr:alpha/beta hydrolase [Xylophilus sp.]KAF1044800.1 MAG: hypothetical protein GAK38_03400 [Xylophilus sp.]
MTAASPQPVVFDRDGRHLRGWYHPPAADESGQVRDCVVVLVPPIGYDAVCTHRHYRALAHLLAALGFPVLRYDHHGTGDSSGSEEDPQRIQAWTHGVTRAVEFARRASGGVHAALFGVRLGGTLALWGSAANPGLADSVVAWAPFPSGRHYLREMRALGLQRKVTGGRQVPAHNAGADLGEEAAGYLLTGSTIAALGKLDLMALEAPPAPAVMLLDRDDIPVVERLARHLGRLGGALERSGLAGYAAMMRDPYEAAVPHAALQAAGDWLAARHPRRRAPLPPGPLASRLVQPSNGGGIEELPVRFGRRGNLFGLLSRSIEPQADRARTGVVFVSVGANLHTGPNRMYVTQARALSGLGFVTLRMDIGGIGESPPSPGHADNEVYAAHSIDDVRDAAAWLRGGQGVERVVLVGLCSGAYLAFHAALAGGEASGIASLVLINQQTYHWRPGDSLAVRSRKGIRSLGFYRSRLRERETWLRILSGQVNLRLIAGGVARVVGRRLARHAADMFRRAPAQPPAPGGAVDVRAAFAGLLRRGVHVMLIFSADDGGLDEVDTHLGPGARRLPRSPHFTIQIVDGADHTFTPHWSQRRLCDMLAQHVMRLYG